MSQPTTRLTAPAEAPPPRRFVFTRTHGLALLLVVELSGLGVLVPGYLDPSSLLDTSRTFIETGILALGMTFVIVSGGIDLSIASLLALVSVVMGLSYQAGLPLPAAMLLGVATGIAGGLVNGAAVAYLGLHPFVVTLATMAIYRGAAYAISNAAAVSDFPPWFASIGQSYIAGGLVPAQLPALVVAALACWLLLDRTTFGRRVYGIGANELATRFSGVPVERVKLAIYGLMGGLVSVAAIIQTARVSTARANASLGLELPVIAMVVLGGTKITGGAGTIPGTVLGVLVLAYLQDGLVSAGVRNDWGLVIVGAFLILGVLANEFFRRAPR
ncbi:ABC transporter permease [Lichenihabitans psoromatis]|uniref:ABC transporter permease n=1 Tax=Lichenihabitans psoromatis TaxID=2528642 RepID=UPI00103839A6|nr:ABC transporter permease [Lichenihabitans psoromatis]